MIELRPPGPDDAGAVAALVIAADVADVGEATRLYERAGMTHRFRVDAYEPPGLPD